LLVTDDPGPKNDGGDARWWRAALEASHMYPSKPVATKEAENFGLDDLNKYEAVCLLNVSNPSPALWERLDVYVSAGKGLAVIVGGEDWLPSLKAYNEGDGRRLLGAKLLQPENRDLATEAKDRQVKWRELEAKTDKASLHPLVRYFRDRADEGEGVRFNGETWPSVRYYWKATPDAGKARPIATYADEDGSPALLENRVGKGRVLLFTTALNNRLVKNQHANNYFTPGSWFGLGLILKMTGYLAGDAETPSFNFVCGQTVAVPSSSSQAVFFTLIGPGIHSASVQRAKGENLLRIPQAVQPGNYQVYDPTNNQRVASFSLNAPAEESQLDRVPVDQIESVLGPGSVLRVERGSTLAATIQGHWLQPLELFPWLMIIVLLVLAVENLLANKFYRRQTPAQEAEANPWPRVGAATPVVKAS
jgi:hypothetical protein